jgi:hypothetical protein
MLIFIDSPLQILILDNLFLVFFINAAHTTIVVNLGVFPDASEGAGEEDDEEAGNVNEEDEDDEEDGQVEESNDMMGE